MPTPSTRSRLSSATLATVTALVALIFVSGPVAAVAGLPERNIVVVVTDDQSLTLGCYGDPVAHSPRLDALAADGVRFTNAFATTASCSPSRSVLLSGLHNHRNGQYGLQHRHHKFASYHGVISLALPRVLADAGYRTARCGKFHVAPEAVYAFEKTIKQGGHDGSGHGDRNVVAMAESCRAFLENTSDERPFFLYFATHDPHRSPGVDSRARSELKPNLFGNLPDGEQHEGVDEVFFDPAEVPVPLFLPDTQETREELAQYYQSSARIDRGLGRLIEILRGAGVFDKTLIVFTSDHGMAFSGAKTTVYDPGLRVPLVVRNPYSEAKGAVADAMVSHVDLTPTLVDFAGALDPVTNAPKAWREPSTVLREEAPGALADNHSGSWEFRGYQGRSWLGVLEDPTAAHNTAIFASHTFHEVTMYYPMRVVRDQDYKLIWNLAHQLPYPFASDLWAASSWQAQLQAGAEAPYGLRTVAQYMHRPRFELYHIADDPHETNNLAGDPRYADTLTKYRRLLRETQIELEDPWVLKWGRE